MKHHDSIKQADKKLSLAIKQLQHWLLPATPINYAVSYEYVNGKNKSLIHQIDQQIATGKNLDNFFIEDIYRQIILGQDQFRDEIITDIDSIITNVETNHTLSNHTVDLFIKKFDKSSELLYTNNKKQIEKAISQIHQASRAFKIQQQKLNSQLLATKKQSLSLKNELEEIRKENLIDPLTGLYNRKALQKHLDEWEQENPNRQVSAIVVNIDQMNDISQRFGGLISDVLLAKIASKVNSYVGESGLPVRSAGDEFLILIPDIERNVAVEIAEKIRQGVEKLRFVSSKTGVRLPQMTLSMGVNDFNMSQNVQAILNQTRSLVNDIQRNSQNKIVMAG